MGECADLMVRSYENSFIGNNKLNIPRIKRRRKKKKEKLKADCVIKCDKNYSITSNVIDVKS